MEVDRCWHFMDRCLNQTLFPCFLKYIYGDLAAEKIPWQKRSFHIENELLSIQYPPRFECLLHGKLKLIDDAMAGIRPS
jgi:hypothetical protein